MIRIKLGKLLGEKIIKENLIMEIANISDGDAIFADTAALAVAFSR